MFVADVVSPQFEKQSKLKKQRLVHQALKDEIAAIHSWTAKCYTPGEWEQELERRGVAKQANHS